MLARDYCTDPIKPVILSHHMLLGLKLGKMSKSDPDSAIFMEDSAADVIRKINKGFCEPQLIYDTEGKYDVVGTHVNPIMDYAQNIVMPALDNNWVVTIKTEAGKEDKLYTSYSEIEKDFMSGLLHPSDLKLAVSTAINKILQPVRDHFTNDPYARNLLETIKRWQEELKA